MPSVGQTHRINYWLVRDGVGLPGQQACIRIRKDSNGAYLQGNGLSFGPAPFDHLLSEPDPHGMPGYYIYDFDQSGDNVSEDYVVRIRVSSSEGWVEEEWTDLGFVIGSVAAGSDAGEEDFGGVIARFSYDRSNRGYNAQFMDGFGFKKSRRMKRIIQNRNKTTNPIEGANAQGQGAGGNKAAG